MPEELHNLFPLNTTTFERYMIADDRDSHPMAAFMEIEIQGPVDPQLLVQAFPAAVDRHPLLRAQTRSNWMGVPYWTLTSPRPPHVAEWNQPLTCAPGESERLDLTAGTGMRTWIRHRPGRTRITIQVHHACSDALGKLTFLTDWLKIYSQLAGNTTPSLSEPNWDAFRRRSRSAPVTRAVRRKARPPGLLYDTFRFFYRSTVRLPGTLFEETNESAPLPGLYDVSIGSQALQRIRHEARRLGVSVNDWLVAAMFVTLAEWTEAHGPEAAHKVFRITLPYNMRTEDSLYSPASNQIGYEILSHRIRGAEDFEKLAKEIARFTGPIRLLRNSSFTKLLRLSKTYAVFVPFIARHWAKSFATVIFSNLGDVSRLFHPLLDEADGRWKVGNLVVDRISCAPPTRPQTHMAMVVLGYGGRLHFVTRCEGRVLAPSCIRAFLDHYRSTVLNLAGVEDEDVVPAAIQEPEEIADSA